MKFLVTGSAGHLGEALVRTLRADGHIAIGLDLLPSPFTDLVGSISDRALVARAMSGVQVVMHSATLHKPHVATHSRQQFVDCNVTGTLNLLEEAVTQAVGAFVFTSTTSTFGAALTPPAGAPAAWVTEAVKPVPKNIYGVSKTAAEDLCQLFHRLHGLPCIVLRTSRFFAEDDDEGAIRAAWPDANVKANEFLYRRVEIDDVVTAHRLAAERAREIGFDRFIISATSPFQPADADELGRDAPAVLRRRVPAFEAVYARLGWRMFPVLDRVYDNQHARQRLGWQPRCNFQQVLQRLARGEDPRSTLARQVGRKPYHSQAFGDKPYPT